MKAQTEWERPIGLTADEAISIDDESECGDENDCSRCCDDDINNSEAKSENKEHQESFSKTNKFFGGKKKIQVGIKKYTFVTPLKSLCDNDKLTTELVDGSNLPNAGTDSKRIGKSDLETPPSVLEARACQTYSVLRDDCNEEKNTVCNDGGLSLIESDYEERKRIAGPNEDSAANETCLPAAEEVTSEVNNPFASFAFHKTTGVASSSSMIATKRKSDNLTDGKNPKSIKTESTPTQLKGSSRATKENMPFTSKFVSSCSTKTKKQSNQKKQQNSECGELGQLSCEDMQKCINKWQSFSDLSSSTESRRFQVLIAARLHARCHENVVRKAMDSLREYFCGKSDVSCSKTEGSTEDRKVELTPRVLAECDPETEISPLLSSVLFGNTKACQIVKAARDVLDKFNGEVPETMTSLQEITGIGPKLAEILSKVNARKLY